MKKTARLCAMLIAVLGAQVLSAQTNIIADWDGGSNTGKPTEYGWKSSNSGRSWSNLNVSSGARMMTSYSGYKLENGSDYKYDANSEKSSKILWIRYANTSETYTYTFTGLEAGKVYTFSGLVGWHNNGEAPTFTITVNGDKELAKTSKYIGSKQTLYPFSVDFMVPADNKSTDFTLKFTIKSNKIDDSMEALSALSIVENTAIANASNDNPYDMTHNIPDPSFENSGSGWDMTTTFTNWGADAIAGDAGKLNKQQWNGNFEVSQTLSNIPNGTYRLSVQGFYRPGGNEATSTAQNAVLYANDTKTGLMLVSAGGKDTQDNANGFTTAYTGVTPNVFVPNSQNDASKAFSTGAYSDNIVKVNVTNNTIKLGVKKETHIDNDWTVIDNFKLEYLGYDLSEALNALNALVTTAQGIIDANEVSPQSVLNLQAAIEAANSVQQTEAAIAEASTALTEAINAANTTIAACNEYKSMLALSESMYTNSTADDKSTFKAAIDKAKSDFNAAANVDAISAIVTDLQNAQKAYCLVAAPAEGHPFDMTFLVVNPKFDEGTTGWAFNTGAPNNGIATNQGGAITGNYFENWQWESYTGEIYQELTDLPKGKYRLTAAAFRDQLIDGASDGDAVYVFANDVETLVNAAAPALYSVEVSTTTGTLRFGVKSKVKKYRWMGIDNVTLEFVERLDLSEFVNAYNEALRAATSARDNAEYNKITGAEKTALLAAIAATPEETQEALSDATAALQSATATFIAAKDSYDLLAVEKETAAGLGMSDALISETVDNKTGKAALPALRVAEYNYVKDEFSYPVELEANGWIPEGPVGTLTGQHYDGTSTSSYLEQSSSAWGASSWEISYKYEKTLPAGKYIFKVAGRRASGTGNTMGLEVTNVDNSEVLGSVNDFPGGDTGLGINKAGVTSFDADDEAGFANDGNGRGWQWRYVMFELSSETTVQVAVNAAATTNHQWMSFCDATLQMTEETYMEANKEGLDAALESAKELVDDDIMGSAEREALQAAIAMPVTTGAEMKAKIDALNRAVAKANDWVAAYNEAKAPLVAALERVPSYTDEEGNSLNKMQTSVWNAVIEAAEAAAMAKDVKDSYEGFADAADNLNSALDAADASIEEYAALKTKIDEATVLTGVNVGDQPFQRSAADAAILSEAIATATDVYNAATAGGEDMTAATDALEEAIATFNNTALNAPAEGQRFYIKVAIEGHGKVGNALLATLGTVGDNNPTGYGLNANYAANGYMNQAFIFTQVGGNLYNISIERPEGTVYLTYGSLNGSAAGWSKQQIQATTDADKKGEFKIEATAKNGIHKIFNTVYNNYLDCQDGGSIYTDTDIEKEEFAFELAPEHEVTLSISAAKWATLILPFDAALPEGVKAYSCGEVAEDGETLTLVEAESIEVNKPYLVSGAEGTYDFSGYGMAEKDTYEDGLFVGTYVDYQTTANSNTYVLQKHDDVVAFYLVGDAEGAQPWIRANRCYMVYEAATGAPMFSLERGEGTTSIDNAQLTIDNVVIYDLMGRKVTTMEKGNMYIVNGKKVIVK